MSKINHKRGLTLIETVLYIALLSILIMTALPVLANLSIYSSDQKLQNNTARDFLFLTSKVRLFSKISIGIVTPAPGEYSRVFSFDTENEGRLTLRLDDVPVVFYEDENEIRKLFATTTHVDSLTFYRPTDNLEKLLLGVVINGIDFGTSTYIYRNE